MEKIKSFEVNAKYINCKFRKDIQGVSYRMGQKENMIVNIIINIFKKFKFTSKLHLFKFLLVFNMCPSSDTTNVYTVIKLLPYT